MAIKVPREQKRTTIGAAHFSDAEYETVKEFASVTKKSISEVLRDGVFMLMSNSKNANKRQRPVIS